MSEKTRRESRKKANISAILKIIIPKSIPIENEI